MNKLFTCTLLLCVWWSQANEYDAAAQTRNFNTNVKEDGSYQYQFDTTNGIAAQESGVGGNYVSGSSAYYAPDGQLITLSYTADENGFHPSGDHLPTSPPIPAAILKSLEYIRTHPRPQPEQDINSDDIKYDIQTKLQKQKQQQQHLQKNYIRNRQ